MAWTDQCRIQAVETIKKTAGDKGISIRKALAEISKESDIPTSTLKKWVYPGDTDGSKNGPTTKKQNTAELISGDISIHPETGELIIGDDTYPGELVCTFISINKALDSLDSLQGEKLLDLVIGIYSAMKSELKRKRDRR